MSDLISRQAAIDLVRDVCDAVMSECESWYDPESEDEVYKDIREVDAILKCNKEVRIALRNMSSAQPDDAEANYWHEKANSYEQTLVKLAQSRAEQPERKKGRWISADEIFHGVPFYCSECGEVTRDTVMWKPRWNFCPNCGADMRGEGAEEEGEQ